MFSPQLMRYIIDPEKAPESVSSNVILKNSCKDYNENLKNDIKSLKYRNSNESGIYYRIMRFFQKNIRNY